MPSRKSRIGCSGLKPSSVPRQKKKRRRGSRGFRGYKKARLGRPERFAALPVRSASKRNKHPEDCGTTREAGTAGLLHGCNAGKESHDSHVDAEGARALAERIAAGKPAEEASAAPEPPRDPVVVEAQPSPAVPAGPVQIVRLKPEPATRREVRIYVRGPNGELERRS